MGRVLLQGVRWGWMGGGIVSWLGMGRGDGSHPRAGGKRKTFHRSVRGLVTGREARTWRYSGQLLVSSRTWLCERRVRARGLVCFIYPSQPFLFHIHQISRTFVFVNWHAGRIHRPVLLILLMSCVRRVFRAFAHVRKDFVFSTPSIYAAFFGSGGSDST